MHPREATAGARAHTPTEPMSATAATHHTPSAEPAQPADRTLGPLCEKAKGDLLLASTKARNPSVGYNMRAVALGGSDWRQLMNFKKLRFGNKYRDVPEAEKQALYLRETVDEFALTEAEDAERLHKVRQAAAARQFEALQALPKFGVTTYANTTETDPDLAEKAIRVWAYLLEGQNGHEALCEARKELDGLLEGAKCLPPPAPVPAPAPAEETPPPPPLELELPVFTGTYDVPQTTWPFQEDDEEAPAPAPTPAPPPSPEPAPEPAQEPAEQTPNAKPAPEAPPEVQHPALTVNVEAATTKSLVAGKNLEAALNAAEDPCADKEKKRKRSE